MRAVLDIVRQELGPEAVRELILGWLPGALAAALTLLVFYGIWRVLLRVLTEVFERVSLDPTASAFILSVARLGFGVTALLTALSQLGVDTTSVLASLGVVGLTLGFAAQDTLSNVISGLFIFWDRPFVLGDLVEVDGEYGRVDSITLRSTRLVTPDGRMFAIPNKVIADAKVASYTNFPNLRLEVPLTVGVDSAIGDVRRALLSAVEGMDGFLEEPAPVVVIHALNDYNIEVLLRAWIADERAHIPMRFALRERVLEAARAANIDMPFETIALAPVEVRQPAAK